MSPIVNLVFEIDSDGAGVDHAANGLCNFASVVCNQTATLLGARCKLALGENNILPDGVRLGI